MLLPPQNGDALWLLVPARKSGDCNDVRSVWAENSMHRVAAWSSNVSWQVQLSQLT